MKHKKLIFLSAFLLISIVLNIFLYIYARTFYYRLNAVHLDPAGLSKFETDNKNLSTKNPSDFRIILLGDSRLAKWQPLPQINSCQVINRAVSGDTTAQVLLRLDETIALEPDLVIIQIGINDIKTTEIFPEKSDQIIENCVRNIQKMTQKLQKSEINTLLLTVFPPSSPDILRKFVFSEDIFRNVKDVNKRLKTLSNDYIKVIDCTDILSDDDKLNPIYRKDMLHLNQAGCNALNDFLTPIIKEFIEN